MSVKSITRFESAFAEYQGAACARAFWMGRVGLYAVLKALGVGEGHRVGICTFTCLGVVESVTRLKARPVFLDVDRHMNISPSALQRLKAPLKALILQHTFGVPCDIQASLEWARTRRVPVIEDSCHAVGAEYQEQRVGRFGLASIYSLQFGKPLIAGQGGMVTFNDPALAQEVDEIIAKEGVKPRFRHAASLGAQRRLFRWFVRPLTRRIMKKGYDWACRRRIISGSEPDAADLVGHSEGFLRLCSGGQAKAGIKALREYPEVLMKRVDNALWMQRKLTDEGLNVESAPPGTMPVYLRLPIWVSGKQGILAQADRERVDIAGWYASPGHPLRGLSLLDLDYNPAEHPAAEKAFAQVVTLPTYPRLSPQQLDHTIQVIKQGSAAKSEVF